MSIQPIESTSFETWEFPESNAEQQYATHNYLRYYGKLPPVVTRRILNESQPYLQSGPGVDVACGSGTTLVEARLLGIAFSGIDVNPVSVLASRVKLSPPRIDEIDYHLSELRNEVEQRLHDKESYFAGEKLATLLPTTAKIDYWFTTECQQELTILLQCIRSLSVDCIRDFFLLALAGVVRQASNASARTGRIFKDADKKPDSPWKLLQKKVKKMSAGVAAMDAVRATPCPSVSIGDAKATGLPPAKHGLVFFHPPYFALYKYSSDVLRFELEWLGFDRKEIVKNEIRDGFKTTRSEDVVPFLDDIEAVLKEGRRIVHPKGAVVVISNNSTLRKVDLPIISGIQERAGNVDLRLVRHVVRAVKYAQSSYHKSADDEIRTPRDHILFFEPA